MTEKIRVTLIGLANPVWKDWTDSLYQTWSSLQGSIHSGMCLPDSPLKVK